MVTDRRSEVSGNLRDVQGFVYLLHLELGRRVRHYAGFSRDPERRLGQHRRGVGASAQFVRRGATVEMVRIEVGTMWDERDLERCLREAGARYRPYAGCWRCLEWGGSPAPPRA